MRSDDVVVLPFRSLDAWREPRIVADHWSRNGVAVCWYVTGCVRTFRTVAIHPQRPESLPLRRRLLRMLPEAH